MTSAWYDSFDRVRYAQGYHTHSLLAMPLDDVKGALVGVILMLNKRGGCFTEDDQDCLQVIAAQAGVVSAA
jgi:hypothetical protein